MSEAIALRKLRGKQACEHSYLEKEYDKGTHTLDYVCPNCGEAHRTEEEFEATRASNLLKQ